MKCLGWVEINKEWFVEIFPYLHGTLYEIENEGEHVRTAKFLIESELFKPVTIYNNVPLYELNVTVDKVNNKIFEAVEIENE